MKSFYNSLSYKELQNYITLTVALPRSRLNDAKEVHSTTLTFQKSGTDTGNVLLHIQRDVWPTLPHPDAWSTLTVQRGSQGSTN